MHKAEYSGATIAIKLIEAEEGDNETLTRELDILQVHFLLKIHQVEILIVSRNALIKTLSTIMDAIKPLLNCGYVTFIPSNSICF